jgi:hypothetical protein
MAYFSAAKSRKIRLGVWIPPEEHQRLGMNFAHGLKIVGVLNIGYLSVADRLRKAT